MERKHAMDARATIIVLVLCLLWGGNQVAIRLSNAGTSPIFGSAVRSVAAGALVALWALARGRRLVPRGRTSLDGIVIGGMFGGEFCLLYLGLTFTTASHGVLFLFTAPFFVAAGAHWLLPGEPLTSRKVLGLLLAFAGVAATLADSLGAPTSAQVVGDLLVLAAGVLWAATSLYLKAVVRDRMTYTQMLFCQLGVSAVLLGALSLLLEPRFIWLRTPGVLLGLFYQSVIVAFASYLVWFWLIQVYPVSLVSAYTFFTPICGVLMGGLLLGEALTGKLLLGAVLVAGGMVFLNWPANARWTAAPLP
jgi:drug/metabolite transporter (DMT)-like permease